MVEDLVVEASLLVQVEQARSESSPLAKDQSLLTAFITSFLFGASALFLSASLRFAKVTSSQ